MRVSLKEFLNTGQLDDLRVGMPPEQVVQLLGDPDMLGGTSRKYHRHSIYKYGSLELHFARELPFSCVGIYIEYPFDGSPIRLPPSFEVEDWDLTRACSRVDVERYLKSNRISYENARQTGLTQELIIRPGGVRLHFDEGGPLQALSVSASNR